MPCNKRDKYSVIDRDVYSFYLIKSTPVQFSTGIPSSNDLQNEDTMHPVLQLFNLFFFLRFFTTNFTIRRIYLLNVFNVNHKNALFTI